MPAIILFDKMGKTQIMANLNLAGSDDEPGDPRRIEVSIENYGGFDIRGFDATAAGLSELAVEDNKIVVFPEKPPEPALPEYAESRITKHSPNSIAFISSIPPEQCGIATYTGWLSEALGNHYPVSLHRHAAAVNRDALIHVQLEFGIFPYVDELIGTRILEQFKVVTWHTAIHNPGSLLDYCHKIDEYYDAHIVHSDLAKKYIKAYTKKPIYVIPHGTLLWLPKDKNQARVKLNLPQDKKIVFCFGFGAESKGFEEIILAARMVSKDIIFIISAAIHGIVGWHSNIVLQRLLASAPENVIVLGRYLNEDEINLYASACDCLLFNYKTPNFISSASGAMHRVLAAGKPFVCSIDTRLSELEDGVHALKYQHGDLDKMVYCLNLVLSDSDLAHRLGEHCLHLAKETSWENTAARHMKVYQDVVGEIYGQQWYDESYFSGKNSDKSYYTQEGIKHWSYYNPDGNWEGCLPIMQAIKSILNPENMLDAGCGRGTFVAYANEVGIKTEGVDFSEWAISNPFQRACGCVSIGDVKDLKFNNESFDLVFASDLMEHIYKEDLPLVIGELRRVSKKWLFFNIGGAMFGNDVTYALKKGELTPKHLQSSAVAGHVTVMGPDFWRSILSGGGWVPRDDLVETFRQIVPADVLQNWKLVLIFEKVGV